MGELLEVFHFDEDRENFEDFALINGGRYWFASDLMKMLGYDSLPAFNKAINRAIAACVALGLSVLDHFVQVKRNVDGKEIDDYKLTRFACYLTTMNGDPRKNQVAAAQVYFVNIAEAVRQHIQEADNVERVLIREEICEREKTLSGVAKQAGIVYYAFFQNAGYMGMYNMTLSQLRARRNLPSNVTPLDFMGKTELAGNLFRITQTEEKIKNENIRGQQKLENAAHDVGRKVRQTMLDISGIAPESLPVEHDIKQVRKGLKATAKEFKKLDGKKT